MRSTGKANQGIALIITIAVITLLIATTVELNRRAGDAAEYSGVTRDRLKLSHITSSGVHLAMALLLKDMKEAPGVDSIQEEWADKETLDDLAADIPFEEGSLSIRIEDELSRIQVNALVKFPEGQADQNAQRDMWEQFLRNLLLVAVEEIPTDDDLQPRAIVNSIKDWIDSGDDDAITGVTGAESDYYEGLDPPYACKNRPMTHVDELLKVKGVGRMVEMIGGWDMFSQYLSVYGMEPQPTTNKFTFPGKININTADQVVIMAMMGSNVDPGCAEEIVAYRQEMTDGNYTRDLTSPDWYKKVPGCGALTIAPELIATKSNFFRITVVGELHNVKMTTVAVVYRENKSGKNECKVLSWQTE